jgi:hypothetical protein
MTPKGHKLTKEQCERLSRAHIGQRAWNIGTGGCKKGHDPSSYILNSANIYVCVECRRENAAKYREKNKVSIHRKGRAARYKVSLDFIMALYVSQDKCCAICRTPIDFDNSRIDHSHVTGEVRGILCTSCNTGIGLLQDNPEILESAAEYIRRNNG